MLKKAINLLAIIIVLLVIVSGCGSTNEKENLPKTESKKVAIEDSIPTEYAYTTAVRINPEIKLFLNIDDKIVGYEYVNDDAKKAFSDIDFIGISLENGLKKIIEASVDKKYLTEGKKVSIIIDDVKNETIDNETISSKVESAVTEAVQSKEISANISVSAQSNDVPKETPTKTSETTAENTIPTEQPTETPTSKENQNTEQTFAICLTCNGDGLCSGCHGTGYLDGATSVCKACGGDGKMTCTFCPTDGTVCQYCGGTGSYACMHCPGDGINRYYCPECSDGNSVGDGLCHDCNGTGVVQ